MFPIIPDSPARRAQLYAYAILAVVGLLIMSLVTTAISILTQWKWYYVLPGVFLVCFAGIVVWKRKKHRGDTRPHTPPDDIAQKYRECIDVDTEAIPPTPSVAPKATVYDDGTVHASEKPSRKKQHNYLKTDSNGVTWLVVVKHTHLSQGFMKKKKWQRNEWCLRLDESAYVDKRLAKRVRFIPTNAETEILWLRLENWWSHGPAQVGIIFSCCALLAGCITGCVLANAPLLLLFSLCSPIILGMLVWYATVWIKWRYKFQLLTNRRVFLLYQPPFDLPATNDDVGLDKLSGGINANTTWWGNIMHYGTVKTGTSAGRTDAWIEDGIPFISDSDIFASRLRQAKENVEAEMRGTIH